MPETFSPFPPLPPVLSVSRAILLAGALVSLLGCGDDSPSTTAPPQQKPSERGAKSEDYWEAICVDGGKTRVGWAHTRIQAPARPDQPVEFFQESKLSMKRQANVVAISFLVRGHESAAGALLDYHAETRASQQTQVSQGEVRDGRLHRKTTTGGAVQAFDDPWGPSQPVGVLTLERSLRAAPLAPGETRSLARFDPLFQKIVPIELKADQLEATSLLTRTETLLRIEREEKIEGQTMKTTLWADAQGTVWKQFDRATQFESYRVSEAEAKAQGAELLDLFARSVIKLSQPVEDPLRVRRARYRLTLKEGDLAACVAQGPGQTLKPLGNGQAELLVEVVPHAGPLSVPATPPEAVDRAATAFAQSDHPRIIALSQSTAAEEKDPWKIGVALEALVQRTVHSVNYTQAFASAVETLELKEGDCTEHAVLLTALCRARGVPARAAIGLIYVPQQQGFLYHMWTEVWTGDRWLGLDAVLGRGGIDGTHLKIGHTSLDGENGMAALLPVTQLLGKLQIELLEADRDLAPPADPPQP